MIPVLSGLQQIVEFSFYIVYFGMISGAVFFILQRSRIPDSYQGAMIISAVVCMIAAMTYYYMKDIYVVGIASGTNKFPTQFRYIDWFLTVPLLMTEFPTLLGMGRRGLQFMALLVVLALIMIGTGFVGEINMDNPTIHYGGFAVGTVAWLMIIGILFFGLSELPDSVNDIKLLAIKRMALFVLIGWAIYPIGYFAPTLNLPPDVRELIYNIADLINKVGSGLVIFAAACAQKKYDAEMALASQEVVSE